MAEVSHASNPSGGNGDPNTLRAGTKAERIQPRRILVALPNWVGDLVMATPALRALRNQFPNAHITFLVKGPLADVLSGGDWMDEVIHWPTGKSRPKRRRGFLGLAATLREQRFDWAVLLVNSFRSALLARLAGIKRRVGYDRDGRGLLLTDRLLTEKRDGKYIPIPMTRYYNAIARYLGCRQCPTELELFTTPEDESAAAAAIEAAGVESNRPIVVLNPGASFGSAKCWLPERFAAVGDRIIEEQNAAVFVSCGPNEIDVAREVTARMRHPATVLDHPVVKLAPLKALIRRASLLVTNDTGTRHFANAFGTPVVTIFGPTDPQWTATKSPFERSLMVNVDCGPCMKRTCPLDHRCMTQISSEMVAEPALLLLSGRADTASVSSKDNR